MAYSLRDFLGGAPSTTLGSDITSGSTSITLTSGTGFPSGGGAGDFFVAIGSLQSNGTFTNLETIRIASRSSNTLTVQTSGRGSDNTTAVAHTAGETIFHCMTALDAYEANHHIADTALDHHTQYLNTTRHDVTARHTFGSAFTSPSAPPSTSTSSAAGSAAGPARSDHTHAIGALSVVAGSYAATSIAAGDIAADAVTTAKILDANVTQAKLDATVTKEITQIVTTTAAYSGTPSEGAKAYETTNHAAKVYDGSNWIIIAEPVQSWTPAFTNLTVGNGTLTGYYHRSDGFIDIHARLIWGTTTSASGTVSITLPVAAQLVLPGDLKAYYYDASGTATYSGYAGNIGETTSATFICDRVDGTFALGNQVTATVPVTFTTSDEFVIVGRYRMTTRQS